MQRQISHLILGLAVFCSGAVMRGDEPVVPVYHEPHHRQVFQYETTRILDVQLPPGETSLYHLHDAPILTISLSASQVRSQNLGQDWNQPAGGRGAAGANGAGASAPAPPAAPGRVSSTTTYAERANTHRIQNIGDRLYRLIAVINETPGDEATTPDAAGFAGTPELTNAWFRAYRFSVAAGETTRPHRHRAPVAIVQVTDGRARGVGAMKFDFTEPGRWAFFDADDAHEIRNSSNAAVSFVEVEIRRPRR